MKHHWMLALALVSTAWAASADRCVTLRLQDSIAVPFRTLQGAQLLTMDLYKEIGVAVKWEEARRQRKATACLEILVRFDSNATPATLPGALAYTTPYEEKDLQIHVFIGRVLRGQQTGALAEANLAHVLAHEIGHVLQGTDRHSDEGVMKAHTPNASGLRDRMRFTRGDAGLIQTGLLKRFEAKSGR